MPPPPATLPQAPSGRRRFYLWNPGSGLLSARGSASACPLTPVSKVFLPFEGLELSRLKISCRCIYPCTCFDKQGSRISVHVLCFNVCVNVNMKIKRWSCVPVPGVFCLFDCQRQEHVCLLGKWFILSLVDLYISCSTGSELHWMGSGSQVNI